MEVLARANDFRRIWHLGSIGLLLALVLLLSLGTSGSEQCSVTITSPTTLVWVANQGTTGDVPVTISFSWSDCSGHGANAPPTSATVEIISVASAKATLTGSGQPSGTGSGTVLLPSDTKDNKYNVKVMIGDGKTEGKAEVVNKVIGVDRTLPSISGSISPEPNSAGWNNGPVTVSWSGSESESNGSGGVVCSAATQISSETSGTRVTGTCSDQAGNTASASLELKMDSTKPVIGATRSPEPNASGWNGTAVVVSFICADSLSGIESSSAASSVTLSAEGANQSASSSGACRDKAGNEAAPVTISNINIDKTAPIITATKSPQPNDNNWNNSDVSVNFACSDSGGSGIAQNSLSDVSVSTEGASQSVTSMGVCRDQADNEAAPVTISNINIDKTAPVITATRSPQPNSNNWNNGAVSVNFACSDSGGSGIAQNSLSDVTVSKEGASQSVTSAGACRDQAGNEAAPVTISNINIDKTAPVITATRSPQPNSNNWNNGAVSVNFGCSDSGSTLSGIESSTVPNVILNIEGVNQSVTSSGTCRDKAGNEAAPVTISNINIDKTAPVITASRTPQPNGNNWNNSDVTINFSCAETGSTSSGIDLSSLSPVILSAEGASQSTTSTGVCRDRAGNEAPATTLSNINIDKTAPSLTASAAADGKPYGANAWINKPVTVSWTCTDSLSGAENAAQPSLLSNEGSGQSAAATCADRAGNSTAASFGAINIDKTAPVITASRTPQPNSNNWNNSDVLIKYSCADSGGSGIAQNSLSDVSVSKEGASQSVTSTGTCRDQAGNEAPSVTVSDINIDKTAPSLTAQATADGKTYAANTWINRPVIVSWTCNDALSGGGSAPSPSTFTDEGGGQSAAATCSDRAGNSTDGSFGSINIDKTAPAITASRTPEPNSKGWNNTDVTIRFSCSDPLSGLSSEPTASELVSSEGANQTRSGRCADRAGNSAETRVENISIDKTPPNIVGVVSPPPNSGTVTSESDVTVMYSCSDSFSGVAVCPNPTTINTTGDHTVTGEAVDQAGNSAKTQVSVALARPQMALMVRVKDEKIPPVGGEMTVEIILKNAPDGLNSYDLFYNIGDLTGGGKIAKIEKIESKTIDPKHFKVVNKQDFFVEFKATDEDNLIAPGSKDIVIAEVKMRVLLPGRSLAWLGYPPATASDAPLMADRGGAVDPHKVELVVANFEVR